jgi:hypothetical protein
MINVKIHERDENEKKLNIKKGNCDYSVLEIAKKFL